MLTTLTRPHFINRVWDSEDAAAAITLLAHCYTAKRKGPATFGLSVSLWGWDRQRGEALREILQNQAALHDFEPDSVALTNSDTLMFTFPTAAFTSENTAQSARQTATNALSLVAEKAFNGVCVELRISSRDATPFAVILYGQVRDGRFWLLAVYPSGAGDFTEEAYGHAPWPQETAFVASVNDFKNGSRVLPSWTAASVFPDETGRTVGGLLSWYLHLPHGKRVSGFLLRVGLSLLVAAVSVWGMNTGTVNQLGLAFRPALLCTVIVALLGLGFHLVGTYQRVVWCRRMMQASSQKMYSQPVAFRTVHPSDATEAFMDPAVQKLTSDVAAAGAPHVRDLAHDPPLPTGESTIRVFQTEDREVLMATLFLHSTGKFRVFPSKYNFHCRTNFDDGSRLISVSGGVGYRKPDPLLPVTMRVFSGETDPASMLAKHRREVAKRIETGARRVAPIDPASIVDLLVEEHEQARASVARRGYFGWGDAVRMVFEAVCPEYRA